MPNLAEAPTVHIAKITPYIGAEVTGVDLNRPIPPQVRQQLIDALSEHIVLVIRDQNFTPVQYITAGRVFGELMEQDLPEIYSLPEQPLIRQVSNRTKDKKDKEGKPAKYDPSWHTDHTNHEHPPKYTMLYPVLLPSSGGGTSVCNMRAAYAALPADIKARIDDMKTVNVLSGSAAKNPKFVSKEGMASGKFQAVIHPLVRTNPDHGTKALYFHPGRTENIVGMNPEDTQDLLRDLTKRAIRPEFVYTHMWRPGDLMIWDNRSALHKANIDYDQSQHRLLYRLIVKGERPI